MGMIETKDAIIRDLQERLSGFEGVSQRPMSRERLPPMEQ